jgi:hypothetical protein
MIRDDPIELLDKIKMLMHDPIRAKYPYASLTEAMSRMLNIKQIESEGLLDYVKRFKESGDIMKPHVTILRFGILPHSTNSTYASFNLISSPSVRYLRTRFFSLLLNCRP